MFRTSRNHRIVALLAVLAVMSVASVSFGHWTGLGLRTSEPNLYAKWGCYRGDPHSSTMDFGSVELADLKLVTSDDLVQTYVGADEHNIVSVSLSGYCKATLLPFTLSGQMQLVVRGKYPSATGVWDTEIIAMDLSGDLPLPDGPTHVQLRKNPAPPFPLPSPGRLRVTDIGGGNFTVHSLFDIFTELSIDGGPFTPCVDWDRMELAELNNVKHDTFYVRMNPDNTPAPDSNSTGWNDGAWKEYPLPPTAGEPSWWNTWFYDDPPDSKRWKKIDYDISVQSEGSSGINVVEVAINWSTLDYPETGRIGPPPLGGDESHIQRQVIFNGSIQDGTTIRMQGSVEILQFNPEWVSVDVRVDPNGQNTGQVIVQGDIEHECLPQNPTLTVINGSGDGTYPAGQVVSIIADPPPAGTVFVEWTGDVDSVAGVTVPTTTLTMPAADVTITVTYRSANATHDTFRIPINPDNTPDPDSNSSGWGGTWTEYPQPDGPSWWTTWFYDDPPDPFRWKRFEYRISVEPQATGTDNYVEVALNWSTADFPETGTLGPPPLSIVDEQFIEREILFAGILQETISLAGEHIIWDFNPDWVSVDVRVDPNAPNPETVIVSGDIWHECLPKLVELTVVNGATTGLYPAGSTQVISAGLPPEPTMIFLEWRGDTSGVADITAPVTTITLGLVNDNVRAFYRWPGDLNGDGVVDIVDLNMVLIDWGKTGGFVDANSDGDNSGTVDIVDLNMVLIDWGKTSPP